MSRAIVFIVSIVVISVLAVVLFSHATPQTFPHTTSQIPPPVIAQQTNDVRTVVFEKSRVKLRIIEWWPTEIVDVTKGQTGRHKGDLAIEIKNVSGKPIKSVEMFIHAPVCKPFAMAAGLVIGLGADNPYFTKLTKPTLDAGEMALINIGHRRLDGAFSPASYEECPPDQDYLFLELYKINYADGTVWEEWHDPDDPNWK